MKVGTVPKITVGAAVLIGLIFIGYIGIRQLNAPTVAERVYLSPWEDGATRPQNGPEELAAQTDSTQDTEVRDNQPQIASTASSEERQPINDLFAETQETDMAQFTTDVKFEPDVDQSLITDTSTLLDDTGQSAEDVMDAFVEAFRNSDFKAMRPLLTANMRNDVGHGGHDDSEIPIEIREIQHESSDGIPDEAMEERIRQLEPLLVESIREAQSQASVVGGEYVGDEFHFLLRLPAPRLPKIPDSGEQGVKRSVSVNPPPDTLIKIRKEEGMWRVYEGGMLN